MSPRYEQKSVSVSMMDIENGYYFRTLTDDGWTDSINLGGDPGWHVIHTIEAPDRRIFIMEREVPENA